MERGARGALAGGQLRRWARWLRPGLGLKRWAVVLAAGILLISAGAALIANVSLLAWLDLAVLRLLEGIVAATGWSVPPLLLGVTLALVGAFVVLYGLRGTLRSIDRVLFPSGTPTLVEVLRQQRTLSRGPKIVALGGGTGLSTLLRGLKRYSSNITAVVTVFDDGGSSGRLRRDLGVLPPGDIRDCLVALAEAEPLMTELFEYRFPSGAFDGHAFGNLFIASLTGVTGDLEEAVRAASKVLNIRGRVLPATLDDVTLAAEYEDGSVVEGESQIPLARRRIRRVFLKPERVAALPEALDAIADADLILIGPGSLYTSVIPNLLVRGVAEAVRGAAVPRVYVCNVMTQPGETDGFSAADHLRVIAAQSGPGLFTHALVNVQKPTNVTLSRRYEAEGAFPVGADLAELRRLVPGVLTASLISEEELLRHDPEALASAVMRLASVSSRRPVGAVAVNV
ncbi:MAG TPA: gluconeogenesis factor YvcK family protein [bacterium]|jgi:uncharacterized cofD-like protein|nr:gluconeogenesis factor YvcK family protein [bacterium]